MIILHLGILDKVSVQEYEWELSQSETSGLSDKPLKIKAIFEVNAAKNRQYDFKGKLYFKLNLKCDRCLKNFEQSFEEDVHFILKKNFEGDELDIIPFDELTCDITDYIRDVVLTSIPMKSLCKKECGGLCEKCGADLNKGACKCKKQEE